MTTLAVAVTGRGVIPVDEPVIRADDEALSRGRAVFETLRVYGGRLFLLDEHLDRLEQSAARIGLDPPPREELEQLSAAALEEAGVPDAMLRLTWTPGLVGIALVAELPAEIDAMRERGARLASLTGPIGSAPWLLGGVKSTSYAVNMAAQAEAQRRGADDAIFVTPDGVVLEGPTTNVWWRKDDTLYTPALELGILAGVTRAALIELSPWPVEEGPFPCGDLYDADELFTSSSVREVMPVVELDGRPIARGPAGDELQAALRRAALAG
jgi:4-amino-4-deoxychorismate lyase